MSLLAGLNLSGIEWCVYTWTVIHGCSYISEGCLYCYAYLTAEMKKRNPKTMTYAEGFRVTMELGRLLAPYGLRQRAIIFLSSMGDLFHTEKQKFEKWTSKVIDGGQIQVEFIKQIFIVMNGNLQHLFMVLTKRPGQALKIADQLKFTDNIMMGTSVESPKYYYRIDQLKQLPGHGPKFLSLEPAISPYVGLKGHISDGKISQVIYGGESYDTLPRTFVDNKIKHGLIDQTNREKAIEEEIALRRSRQMTIEDAIQVKEICRQTGVHFFFKQYGYLGSRKHHRLLPDLTVEEYQQVLRDNGWAEKSLQDQIRLIGRHPTLFNARIFNEFPEPGLSILKEQRPELFADECGDAKPLMEVGAL